VCRLLVKNIDQRLQSRQERSCGAQSDGEKIQSNTSTLVAVFTIVRMRRVRSPASKSTVVVAKPVSASRRALSVTWRLTYFRGVAKA
jgi:hypothetical protein